MFQKCVAPSDSMEPHLLALLGDPVGLCVHVMQPEALFNKMRASARDMFLPNTVGPANDQPTAGPDRYTGFGFLNGGAALVSVSHSYIPQGATSWHLLPAWPEPGRLPGTVPPAVCRHWIQP